MCIVRYLEYSDQIAQINLVVQISLFFATAALHNWCKIKTKLEKEKKMFHKQTKSNTKTRITNWVQIAIGIKFITDFKLQTNDMQIALKQIWMHCALKFDVQ